VYQYAASGSGSPTTITANNYNFLNLPAITKTGTLSYSNTFFIGCVFTYYYYPSANISALLVVRGQLLIPANVTLNLSFYDWGASSPTSTSSTNISAGTIYNLPFPSDATSMPATSPFSLGPHSVYYGWTGGTPPNPHP
jgi:hypothetical protein